MGDCCWLKQHISLGEKASNFEIKWEMRKRTVVTISPFKEKEEEGKI